MSARIVIVIIIVIVIVIVTSFDATINFIIVISFS